MTILTVKSFQKGWAVFNGDQPVTRAYSCEYTAQGAATRLEKDARKRKRSCMCCDELFLSEGPHNRMCKDCRSRTEGLV